MSLNITSRSLIQRSLALLALIFLSMYLFYIGKGHTLLIDTNAITINGQEFKSPESIEVSVNGQAAETMGRAERIMVNVGGPQQTIRIAVISGGERMVTQKISVPTFMDAALVSVPAILGDAPESSWVSEFVPPTMEDASVETMQHQADD